MTASPTIPPSPRSSGSRTTRSVGSRGGSNGKNDLLRRILLMCFTVLSGFTLSNLQYLQKTLDSFTDIDSFSFNVVQLSVNVVHRQPEDYNPNDKKRSNTINNDELLLPCLVHEPFIINASEKRVSDPTKTRLEQNTTFCGSLRRQWLYNQPLSRLARQIETHQTDCSLPMATHSFDNIFGLGSHLILWGQAMCNGMQAKVRMRSHSPEEWLWLDQQHCDMKQAAEVSPMLCYFPNSEYRCNQNKTAKATVTATAGQVEEQVVEIVSSSQNISDPRKRQEHCTLVKQSPELLAEYRAAATEFFFQRVSPLVIQEAKRQTGIVFPGGVAPANLVTLHIRWGDKFWEMNLPPIQEYMDAIRNVTKNSSNNNGMTNVNIYLSTEDPTAYKEFMKAVPDGWNVYPDVTLQEINAFRPTRGNRASWATRNTKGRAGLVALGSLLVAMEASMFVLTTKSNWSTLMDHLRTNIIDPRCGNCTKAIDLRPGVYL